MRDMEVIRIKMATVLVAKEGDRFFLAMEMYDCRDLVEAAYDAGRKDVTPASPSEEGSEKVEF